MNSAKVRIIHRRLGISMACFLVVQAIAGMFMSIGRLVSVDMSPAYNVLYFIHADWNPLGSFYRVVLGLATTLQGVLGMIILLKPFRFKKKEDTSFPPLDQPDPFNKEVSMRALGFAANIRPLFRDRDIKAMEPMGIDLSSYKDVKKHAQDIYARHSAKEMPCDGPWTDDHLQKLKDWMESGLEP